MIARDPSRVRVSFQTIPRIRPPTGYLKSHLSPTFPLLSLPFPFSSAFNVVALEICRDARLFNAAPLIDTWHHFPNHPNLALSRVISLVIILQPSKTQRARDPGCHLPRDAIAS
jgi:hypothetical protein